MSETPEQPTVLQSLLTHKLWFWIPAVIALVLDLWSKSWALGFLTVANTDALKGETLYFERKDVPHDGVPFIEGVLHFKWAENTGAAFSMGAGNTGLLLALGFGVLGILFFYIYKTPRGRWLMLMALGLIAGGAIGNVYDRSTHLSPNAEARASYYQNVPYKDVEGLPAVRDMLYFPFDIPIYSTWGIPEADIKAGFTRKYPVFNVADMTILGGVIIMIAILLFTKEEKDEKAKEDDSDDDKQPVAEV